MSTARPSATTATTVTTSTTTTENDQRTPQILESFNGMLKLFNDGTIFRHPCLLSPNPIPPYDDHKYPSVTYFDFLYDPTHNLSFRVYKHQQRQYRPHSTRPPTITFYVHGGFGGGFCLGSKTMAPSHNLCLRLCHETMDLVVSVDYRLAPESRLPAAVADVWTALKCMQATVCLGDEENDWGRVVIFGDSAGGNIAHNLAVRIASGGWKELYPVRVMGYVLLAPMFGGGERTKSEVDESQSFFNFDTIERCWRLAIPTGETTDYPLMNPFGPRSSDLEQILITATATSKRKRNKKAGVSKKQIKELNCEAGKEERQMIAPVLIMVGEKDLLRDRIKDYANNLCKLGTKVEFHMFEGLEHGFLATSSNPEPLNNVVSLTKKFNRENSS